MEETRLKKDMPYDSIYEIPKPGVKAWRDRSDKGIYVYRKTGDGDLRILTHVK